MKPPQDNRPPLSRDGQQWFFDYMIQETGKVFHFQTDGRGNLPKAVRRHAMISKHLGMAGRRMQRLAEEEVAEDHRFTALARFYDASLLFAHAQHTIFENTDEKRYLHSASLSCFEHVRELASYKIERIELDWNGTKLFGNLHLAPGEGPAPCVLYAPGCDATKEMYPNPLMNHALQRGMHVFSIDGPGQGESNLRGIKLTVTNYEEAASIAIDYLTRRAEVDPQRIGVHGNSFGSYWAMRIAAHDHRVSAVAAPMASYADIRHLMNEESPRYKQLFMYLTGSESEHQLDEMLAAMRMNTLMHKIVCPSLSAVGEYDPRSPLAEVYELFDQLGSPGELWVFADQHHKVSLTRPNAEVPNTLMDIQELVCDWLRDRFDNKPMAHPGQVTYVDPNLGGPYGRAVSHKRAWYQSEPR